MRRGNRRMRGKRPGEGGGGGGGEMECPTGSLDNPVDSRFCENCGQPLEGACPNCGQAVPAAAKFCRHCGHDLAQAAPAPPSTIPRSAGLEAIRRAAPSAMAKKILPDP